MKKSLSSLIVCLLMMSACVFGVSAEEPPACMAELVIHLTGFENSDGMAKMAVVDSKAAFTSENTDKGYNLKIVGNKADKTLKLPCGEYAVKVFHDENGNGILDRRIFGIPAERYGFSNDARSSFGPPEYEQAVFTLDSAGKKITIHLN